MAEDEISGPLSRLLQAVQEFHGIWFPDKSQPDSVQGFWFGAKRPRDRKLFRHLFQKFREPLHIAEHLYESKPVVLESLDPTLQLQLAVFLDQQSRNQRAILDRNQSEKGEEESNVENQILRCSRIARILAGKILQVSRSCAGLLEATGATTAQVCFFTLVLRHTKDLEDVRVAQQLLDELQQSAAHATVDAFRAHNAEVLAKLESEAYVREALASHTPCRATSDGARPLATVCLAKACLDFSGHLPENCLEWASHDRAWDELASHPLCQDLQRDLASHSLMTPAAHILLSYSGGVDSTAHLILLLALGRCFQGPRISCLLLSYPNRQPEEVRAEQQWASWVCHRLQVDFFIYEVRLARPHADARSETSGLSREDYERWTKEIRYRMYGCLLSQSAGESSAVVLGHHQDDVDENRLDHLMKGHVLGDVEGMWAWRRIHDVQLCRPLLHRRKADFLNLLDAFPTPFFRDSTPLWSVRGATRAAMDALQPDVREFLVLKLQSFGHLSLEVGNSLDHAVSSWALDHVHLLLLPRNATAIALNLDALFDLDIEQGLKEVMSVISDIRQVWNPLVSMLRGEGLLNSSSIAAIPENSFDIPSLLFEKGFFSAAENLMSKQPGHYHSSEVVSVNRKAAQHLYANIRNCAKPQFSGGLTQE